MAESPLSRQIVNGKARGTVADTPPPFMPDSDSHGGAQSLLWTRIEAFRVLLLAPSDEVSGTSVAESPPKMASKLSHFRRNS